MLQCDAKFSDALLLENTGLSVVCAPLTAAAAAACAADPSTAAAGASRSGGGGGGGDTVLLLGSGGREHAIAHSLSRSPAVGKVFVSPGNFGTGDALLNCENVPELQTADEICRFVADNLVSLVVVGPEQPLVDGIADALAAQVCAHVDIDDFDYDYDDVVVVVVGWLLRRASTASARREQPRRLRRARRGPRTS